ncbi:TPA: hypothetical protein ACKTGI_002754 [Pseudomonas aeruginosa]
MRDRRGRTQQINFKIKPELKAKLDNLLTEQNEMATDFFERIIKAEIYKHEISKLEE